MTWSRQLFQFVLCGHPTPRCWTSQEHELSSRVGLFRSWLRTLGTHYHPTLDPAVLWTPSNDPSRPICSDSLNLMPPAPPYLRTLWRYTNAVIINIIITYVWWLWRQPSQLLPRWSATSCDVGAADDERMMMLIVMLMLMLKTKWRELPLSWRWESAAKCGVRRRQLTPSADQQFPYRLNLYVHARRLTSADRPNDTAKLFTEFTEFTEAVNETTLTA